MFNRNENENEIRNLADVLCKTLGKHWEPRVWQNMGYHFSATLVVDTGTIEVHPNKNGTFWINAHLPKQSLLTVTGVDEIIGGVMELINESTAYAITALTTNTKLYKLLSDS